MSGVNENRTHPAVKAIKSLLDERGINNSELARRLGWGRMQVQRRLSGDAHLTVAELEQIAAVLDVPASAFLAESERAA